MMEKHNSIDENIMYVSSVIHKLLKTNNKVHIDKLFEKYSEYRNIELSVNTERIMYLSLVFMFSIDMIEQKSNIISLKGVYNDTERI